jgi:hypothetical protein
MFIDHSLLLILAVTQDLIDLRAHRWVARRKVEGPKKIDDIHKDARAELQRQRMAPLPDRRERRPPERAPLPLCAPPLLSPSAVFQPRLCLWLWPSPSPC